MTDLKDEIIEEVVEETVEEVVLRLNPFCVISKATYGEGETAFHDIQTNGAWSGNPYGEEYAVVPDEMVEGILETDGFCDIVLSEDGTEVVSFVAREKVLPEPEPEPEPEEPETESVTWDAIAEAIKEGVNEV